MRRPGANWKAGEQGVNWKGGAIWSILLIATNLFFILVVWLAAPRAFGSVVTMMVLFAVMVILAGYWASRKKQKKQMAALKAFLLSPEEETEQALLAVTDPSWHPIIQAASARMREQMKMIKDKQLELENYQEFIEAWTHEIKTPLSLATLVLNNHREDMSPYVYQRMEHVRSAIGGDVERILYYARLHADHVDYKFERILLRDCLEECLDSFRAISHEKGVELRINLPPLQVISDKKVLVFILSQLLSNAFKYAAPEKGIVNIAGWKDSGGDQKIHLTVQDNGKGVPPEDVPFLFDKGFTGNHPERQEATGMGLYLVGKYAEALAIDVKVGSRSTSGKGFEMELIFPHVEQALMV